MHMADTESKLRFLRKLPYKTRERVLAVSIRCALKWQSIIGFMYLL